MGGCRLLSQSKQEVTLALSRPITVAASRTQTTITGFTLDEADRLLRSLVRQHEVIHVSARR